jgi:hypothetical protein
VTELPLLLRANQAMKLLGVTEPVLRRWRNAGLLDACLWCDPVTGYVYYRRDALTAWAAGQNQGSAA